MNPTAVLLRSECGQYQTERSVPFGDWRNLYDRDGRLIGKTGYWGNRYTKSRIGFEVACGEIEATFSYPRYPRWFRRRWALCFDLWIDELADLARGYGCDVLVGYKPDINVWSHLGVRATAEQVAKLDAELKRRGVEWNGPPCRPGQWDIECPLTARG